MDKKDFSISLPEGDDSQLDQDEEFCILEDGQCRKRVRFHDYHEIYKVKGLYEHLFYEKLKCNSPQKVCEKLLELADETHIVPAELNVLDIGAGNGMMGEELVKAGIQTVVGVDIIPEAREALLRDRPGMYETYLVEDLTDMSRESEQLLQRLEFNCMTTVAALGFGDIPPLAFANGFNFVEDGGILAFNIRDKFIEEPHTSDFANFIGTIEEEGLLEIHQKEKYCHRLNVEGDPIDYYVVAGIKQGDIPVELVEQLV